MECEDGWSAGSWVKIKLNGFNEECFQNCSIVDTDPEALF